ncbi:DUF2961 domain-containing protein [Tessaracoccus coleopterorum]|nr:DUF2961 domain-containing protein [Tessaracoccus coleopterorum]
MLRAYWDGSGKPSILVPSATSSASATPRRPTSRRSRSR